MSHKLIVTADDYGMCNTVNAAIDECLAAGTVKATCIMVNMPAFGGAVSLARRFPQASVGLHWTLTQGCPILSPARVPTLVNAQGEFHAPDVFRRHWLTRKIRVAEVTAELRAQFERFQDSVGIPEFWNTHQNVHVWPGLFQLFVRLGHELGIRSMRCHERIAVSDSSAARLYNLRHPVRWLKSLVISFWSRRARCKGTSMPDGLVFAPGHPSGMADIEAIAPGLPWHRVRLAAEMIIHPATTSGDVALGRLTESRVREYKVFRDPALAQRLDSVGIVMIGYQELVRASGAGEA